jgi:hypothetical protein
MHCSKLILALFCVTFLHDLNAQNNLSEGYYVGFQKDTVRGFFNLENLANNKVLFYATKTAKASQKLTPETIQKIETLDKISISTFIYTYKDQREPLFLEKYAAGNVSLYKAHSLNPDEKEVFFISSTKMPLIRKISAINPKMFLNTYFKGCELSSSFGVAYTANSLLAAVTEIGKCAYPDKEIIKDMGKVNTLRVKVGVKSAVSLSYSKVKAWFGDRETDTKISPLFGGIVAFGISNNFEIYTGLNYFERHVTSARPVEIILLSSNYPKIKYDYYNAPALKLSTRVLEIPMALHYEFSNRKPAYVPKVLAGASILLISNPKFDIRPVAPAPPYPIKLYETNTNFSFFVGLGVKKALANKAAVELNLKYAYESEDVFEAGRIYTNRYELSVAYLFPWFKNH